MKKKILIFIVLIMLGFLLAIKPTYAFIPPPTNLSNTRTTYSMGWVDQYADNPATFWYRFHVVRYQTDNTSIYYTHFINQSVNGFITTSASTDIDVAIASQTLNLNDTSYWTFIGTSSNITMYVWIRATGNPVNAQNAFDNIFRSTSPYYSWVYMDNESASITSAKAKALVYLADVETNSYFYYNQGYQYGYDVGYDDGVVDTYQPAYDDAKTDYGLRGGVYGNADYWFSQGQLSETDLWGSLLSAFFGVFAVLSIEILPGIQLGYFVGFFLVLGVAGMIIGSFMIRRK